eukprot:3020749-Pyramimonas_sp.AAC.1
MSDAQKKHYAAGDRLRRKCAEERENEIRRRNAEAANRKRKAEADAKPLTCRRAEERSGKSMILAFSGLPGGPLGGLLGRIGPS